MKCHLRDHSEAPVATVEIEDGRFLYVFYKGRLYIRSYGSDAEWWYYESTEQIAFPEDAV